MFEPTTLPTATSGCRFNAATTDVASSGMLVPKETTPRSCGASNYKQLPIYYPFLHKPVSLSSLQY